MLQTLSNPEDLVRRLRALQEELRESLRSHMADQEREFWARTVRDDAGDTVFGIDAAVEETLLERCEAWAKEQPFVLLAEGLDEAGVHLGKGAPAFRLIADPIDGTRGLMYDKRSAFCLMGVAPDRGAETRLSDVEVAVMTELPTTRQATCDCLWAVRGGGVRGERLNSFTGQRRDLALQPSRATTLTHGFATVNNFLPGGKVLTAEIEEQIFEEVGGPWNPAKAEVYCDHYICAGGQLAELALGRDRFVADFRPLVHAHLGHPDSLCCKPYDLCCALVAQEAGCVVESPDGSALDAPLDLTSNVAFCGYANTDLAARMRPAVRAALARLQRP